MKGVDTVIVGGGISGLYTAYLLLKKNPKRSLVILEKADRIGGRIGNVTFAGTKVVTGAGIGRKKKDILLQNLLKELNVSYREFFAHKEYLDSTHVDVGQVMKELSNKYVNAGTHKHIVPRQTFKEFACKYLTREKYDAFVEATGYSDFENADVGDVINYYGMDDNNTSGWTGLGIPWNDLIASLVKFIGKKRIVLETEVSRVKLINDSIIYDDVYHVHCSNGTKEETYQCNYVVIATPISTIKKLLPAYPIYKQIKAQPFLRVYAQFSKDCAENVAAIVDTLMVVPAPLQEIIPMNVDKGVYMIAYADNASAQKLHSFIVKHSDGYSDMNNIGSADQRKYFERLLTKTLEIPIEIIKLTSFYFNEGTHYNLPLSGEYSDRKAFVKVAHRPSPKLFVVGEAVALHQGWCEGALETVQDVINEIK